MLSPIQQCSLQCSMLKATVAFAVWRSLCRGGEMRAARGGGGNRVVAARPTSGPRAGSPARSRLLNLAGLLQNTRYARLLKSLGLKTPIFKRVTEDEHLRTTKKKTPHAYTQDNEILKATSGTNRLSPRCVSTCATLTHTPCFTPIQIVRLRISAGGMAANAR